MRRGWLAAVLAVLVVVTACSDGSNRVDSLVASPEATAGGTAATDGEAADGPAPDEAGTGQDAADAGADADADAGADGSGGDEGDGSTDDGPQLSPVADDGPVGANAAAYLRGDRSRVVLEVDAQEGAELPASVLDHLRQVLARESNANVEVQTGPATTTRRDAWTPDQLRAAADETRTVAHDDDTAVLHLLVLRDRYEDDGVLGLAFGSSSAVVFPDQWSDLTTALLSGDRIARAVTTHEMGHLLGLVGLFEEPATDHEDPEHPGHTTDRDDVMYYAVERDIISQLDGIPTDFGPNTRRDLAGIREG